MNQIPLKIGLVPSHPGIFLRDEVLGPLNLSITAAAAALGVRRATLSELVNERSSLTPEMALRIEKAFGISMDTLLGMQAWRHAADMRQMADRIDVPRYVPVEPRVEAERG